MFLHNYTIHFVIYTLLIYIECNPNAKPDRSGCKWYEECKDGKCVAKDNPTLPSPTEEPQREGGPEETTEDFGIPGLSLFPITRPANNIAFIL